MNEPGKRGSRRQQGAERRQPPPSSTGREQELLQGAQQEGATLCLHLGNGEIVRGRIEEFDRHSVRLTTSGGHRLFVPLTEIRYIEDV